LVGIYNGIWATACGELTGRGLENVRFEVPYRYLEEIAISDVAFKAWGSTTEELFVAASDATLNVMVEDLDTISDRVRRSTQVEEDAIDMLLFQFLQELIFLKDAEQLLLRVSEIRIENQNDSCQLSAEVYGEKLNPDTHELLVDVKAVTLHRFHVGQTPRGWEATVILDT
jgi:SHS2 domain-containing protein